MEKLTFDNAFLGAKIIKYNKTFYIYKINSGTFYYGEESFNKIKSQWENKSKGVKWKKIMENFNARHSTYDEGFYLANEQEETVRIKKLKEEKESKKYLSTMAEKRIITLFNDKFMKNKMGWRGQIEIGKETFSIIEMKENGNVLLAFDGNFVFFNVHTRQYVFWRAIDLSKKEKEVPWPKQEVA